MLVLSTTYTYLRPWSLLSACSETRIALCGVPIGKRILTNMPAYVECTLESTVEMGDHSIFVGKVVDAGVAKQPEGRADDATLWLKELGDKVFYGG